MIGLTKDFNLKEWISAILPMTKAITPLLSGAGRGQDAVAEQVTYYTTKQLSREGTATAGATNADTTISVSADLRKRLTEGYILMHNEELIKVTGKPADGNITVKRGYANTPATAIASGDKIKILSKAEKDGKVTEDFVKIQKVASTNIIQEFTHSVYTSKRAAALQKKDYGNLIQEEKIAKIDEQGTDINLSMYYGQKYLDWGAGTGDEGRNTMGGWKQAIATDGGVIFDAEQAFTEDKFENLLLAIAGRNGKPTEICLNSVTKKKVFETFKNVVRVYPQDQSNQKGGGIMTGYLSDALGYELSFVIDNDINNGDIFVGKRAEVLVDPLVIDGEDQLFAVAEETNTSSAEYNATIRSIITTEYRDAYLCGYMTNVI